MGKRIAEKAKAAVSGLSHFVIRHSIEDLPREHDSFGVREDWEINVPHAKPMELELMMRIDRALRIAKGSGLYLSKATNDPRFHVGWRHFDEAVAHLRSVAPRFAEPAKAVIEGHIKAINKLRAKVRVHSKMSAVEMAVRQTVVSGEKVLLFCHHHATAQELTARLALTLPMRRGPGMQPRKAWLKAWNEVLPPGGEEHRESWLRETFIEWLCADLIRTQTWAWICDVVQARTSLGGSTAENKGPRGRQRNDCSRRRASVYRTNAFQIESSGPASSRLDRLGLLPGADGSSRVLGVCEPSGLDGEESLFIHNQQPDTVISIFNSPFGPDALVVTDKLSEGIDLHRYCRHVVHYELDPSPMRTIQRNGRLRRVNCWAALTGQKIHYAYPTFRGTRDHRLVQIMKKRIDSFSLLLGGVQDFDVDEVLGSDEAWRNNVITIAKGRLAHRLGGNCNQSNLESCR